MYSIALKVRLHHV